MPAAGTWAVRRASMDPRREHDLAVSALHGSLRARGWWDLGWGTPPELTGGLNYRFVQSGPPSPELVTEPPRGNDALGGDDVGQLARS